MVCIEKKIRKLNSKPAEHPKSRPNVPPILPPAGRGSVWPSWRAHSLLLSLSAADPAAACLPSSRRANHAGVTRQTVLGQAHNSE